MNILETIEGALRAVAYPEKPEGLYEPISYTLALGGKRIRPTLTLLAYQLYKDDVETALPAALAIETYHNHTLLHDDLMDHAAVRRGQPTVHRKWDANTAILSGDTMLIMSMRHALRQKCSDQGAWLDLLTRTMQEICEGQQMDMNFEQRTDVSEEEYIEMIRLKTSVLLACSLEAGALCAGASAEDRRTLYRFGEALGLAFQLQDDWLDCYGAPAVFGKRIGGDILCGKKTYLLISAFRRANRAQYGELLRLLSLPAKQGEERIAGVLKVYDELGVSDLARQRIAAYTDEALHLLDSLPVSVERKQPLRALAEKMLRREK